MALRGLLVAAVLVVLAAACDEGATAPLPDESVPSTVAAGPAETTLTFDTAGAEVEIAWVEVIDVEANDLAATVTPLNGWTFSRRDAEEGEVMSGGDGASLRVPLPPGSEGVLIRIRAEAETDVAVTPTGERAVALAAGDEWRTGYVPVGPSQPIPVSGDPPQWIEEEHDGVPVRVPFPEFSDAERLFVLPARTDLNRWFGSDGQEGWRVTDAPDVVRALTLVGMQGIINRTGPEVYLDWGGPSAEDNVSQMWLPELERHVRIVELDLDSRSAIRFLWRRYGDRFSGAVLYDPEIADTINVATMIAGLEDRLILAPEQLDDATLQVADVYDLVELAGAQGWDGTRAGVVAVYRWVYENLWPDLDHRILGVLSPGPPTSCEFEPGRFDPIGLAVRDYLVALRLPVLWLSPTDPEEAILMARILGESPSPIPVTTFYGCQERETVAMASRHGNWVAVLTNSNAPLTAPNLTVFGGVRPPVAIYEPDIDPERIRRSLAADPVVTIWMSDGDALHIQVDRGIHGGVDFRWDNNRDQPFAWTINSTLADLAPVVWNHYLTTAEGPSFVAALSGGGYANPVLMDDEDLDAYLAHTRATLERTGLVTVWVDETLHTFGSREAARYREWLTEAGYVGTIAGFFSGTVEAVPVEYPGVPTPVVRNNLLLTPGSGAELVEALVGPTPGITTIELADYPFQEGEVVADADADGGRAVRFSRPALPPCCLVVSGPGALLAPGEYEVTYRLKVEDVGDGRPIATIYAFDGDFIASRTLAPSDFVSPGQYQDFTLSFTLTEVTPGVEFRLDFLGDDPNGGAARGDLYAQSIVATQIGVPAFPIIGAVFIGLVGPIDPLDADLGALVDGVEAAGGMVLSPDEFLASMNPEYLLDLAIAELGAADPSVQAAGDALAAGDPLTALIALRTALRLP